MTQESLAQTLKTTRRSIIQYEDGSCPIPMAFELAMMQLTSSQIALAGIVAAGAPIEPILQTERVEVPKSIIGRGDTFALRVKGISMKDEGDLSRWRGGRPQTSHGPQWADRDRLSELSGDD